VSAGRLLLVVGARPNFVKMAPLARALAAHDADLRLLHTGQHYDRALSGAFFEQLGLPRPDVHLGVGSGTHAEQTAGVLVGVERELRERPAEAVVVCGDVNSTLAAALAAVKAGVAVIHLESGLRSGDWKMPEEVNRVLTDRLSDLLLCHSPDALDHLAAEGIPADRVALVGNTMIDTLHAMRPAAEATAAHARLGLADRGYALVTLHRPALVDHPERLRAVFATLERLAAELPVVIPIHPRTAAGLREMGWEPTGSVRLLEPLEYLEFLCLEAHARLVVTDSGGVQEETSVLGVPCLTYRTTTERPVTIDRGTNRLVGVDPEALASAAREVLESPMPPPAEIPLWDGHAGERAAATIATWLDERCADMPAVRAAPAR
jgi:UDP-N-acetylglucosamine 2-epimerase (non-hydrolysing)